MQKISRFIVPVLFSCLIPLSALPGLSRELAVTIDDLPFAYGADFSYQEKTRMVSTILSVLKKYKIQIVGFAIGRSINDQTGKLLDQVVAEGHLIGNHTFSHPDLNKTDITYFKISIGQGAQTLKKWLAGEKYFRYPMLHRGDTELKKDIVSVFLKQQGYITVPVTIDNDDWLYNRNYIKALKKNANKTAERIGNEYLAHMRVETSRNEQLAIKRLGRKVKHILLLHMNMLNSVYLDELLSWYRDEGWKFISVKEALSDPVYSLKDTYTGKWGWSWLRRIEGHPQQVHKQNQK